MAHLIETEIDGVECAFYVDVLCNDDSFDYAYGSQRTTEHRISFEFEIEHWEGCTKAQALQWCEDNASRLIEREIKAIESNRMEAGVD